MQITSFFHPAQSLPHAASTQATSNSGSSSSSPSQSTNDMFLQLLTAQIQNQSPLDPVDPMTFTTQLVQFNMLDQLTQINSVLQQSLGTTAPTNATQPII